MPIVVSDVADDGNRGLTGSWTDTSSRHLH